MLEVTNLSVAYGGLRALTNVSLSVKTGQFVTVVGPNGAGKSTLFKTISGIVLPASGQITFLGQDLRTLSAARRAHLGIAHVPEGRQVFKTLTVRENLEMGAYPKAGRAAWHHTLERIHTLFPILFERAGQLAGTLSGGEQQMVAIARALISQPRILMLDEPTLGLAPKLILEVAKLVRTINGEGITVVLVEQNAKLALRISDYAFVLETGSLTLEGASADLLASDNIHDAYLGGGNAKDIAFAGHKPV
jgi:branched-chain amino acid transport system ATP-binding protein